MGPGESGPWRRRSQGQYAAVHLRPLRPLRAQWPAEDDGIRHDLQQGTAHRRHPLRRHGRDRLAGRPPAHRMQTGLQPALQPPRGSHQHHQLVPLLPHADRGDQNRPGPGPAERQAHRRPRARRLPPHQHGSRVRRIAAPGQGHQHAPGAAGRAPLGEGLGQRSVLPVALWQLRQRRQPQGADGPTQAITINLLGRARVGQPEAKP